MPAETSQTLDRGLRVLDVLKVSPGGLTVTELAARLGVNRTVVYRLVSTLEQHALIRKDGHGRLHVGLGVLHLAAAVQPVLRDLAVPVLRGLAEKAGCTAHLLGRDPGSAAYAVTEGELQAGARGLAAPVRGVEGLEASVGIVTLGVTLDTERIAPLVSAAAAEVAARLS